MKIAILLSALYKYYYYYSPSYLHFRPDFSLLPIVYLSRLSV